MNIDYGKFKKKNYKSNQDKDKGSKFTSSAPMTVLAADFHNSKDDTRIGTGFIFQSGKYAGEGFTISCDPDDRSKKLWYERKHKGLTVISNQKFNQKSGPVTILVEDEDATSKSGLTPIGKGYYKDDKVSLKCYHDDPRAEQLWHEKCDKFLVFPDRR